DPGGRPRGGGKPLRPTAASGLFRPPPARRRATEPALNNVAGVSPLGCGAAAAPQRGRAGAYFALGGLWTEWHAAPLEAFSRPTRTFLSLSSFATALAVSIRAWVFTSQLFSSPRGGLFIWRAV